MTKPLEHLFVLPGDLDATRLKGKIGKLRVRVDPPLAPVSFQLWDCFDHPLLRAGKTLLEFEDRFYLISDTGRCVTQSAKRTGNFVSDLVKGPVKQGLDRVSALRALLETCAGQLETRHVTLLDALQKTQARAAIHTLRTQNGVVTLVSVQRMRGYDKAYVALENAVKKLATADAPNTEILRSLGHDLPLYRAKPDFGFDAETSINDAVTEITRGLLEVARANEAGIIADHDTEFLHDYRVALRKIRSLLGACKGVYSTAQKEALSGRFDDLMAQTGCLRDLDVQELDLVGYFDSVPEDLHPGLHIMARVFRKQRMAEHRKFAKYLSSRSYQKTIEALVAQLSDTSGLEAGPKAQQTNGSFASKLIWKRYKKLQQAVQVIDINASDAQLHDVRVLCKRLRYLIELFGPLYRSKRLKPLMKSLKKMQEDLGAFNDCVVQQDALQRVLRTHVAKTKAESREMALSVGGIVTALTHRQQIARAKSIARLSHLGSPDYEKNLRQLLTEQGARV
jgi:CHAD domain-containing protein